jgi:hypothetical protein
MIPATRRRWLIGAGLALAALAAAAIVAFGAAVALLKGRVAQALGPTSEVAALRVGWSGVVIEGLRIPGPPGWPAKDALRAERVTVTPTLRSLISGETYRIASVTITRLARCHGSRESWSRCPVCTATPRRSPRRRTPLRTSASGRSRSRTV